MIQLKKKNPYVECPVFETDHFVLRLVAQDDAADLLICYADKNARPLFNSDACTGDFFMDDCGQMRDCIAAWLSSYAGEDFIRFSVLDRRSKHAVGTIEMFGMVGKYKTARGILRLDIASPYEKAAYLDELFSLCLREFFDLFAVGQIVTKAIPQAAERIRALKGLGFASYDFPQREHYWISARDACPCE